MRQRGERGVQQAAHAERGAAPPRVMLCHCGLNLTVLHREPRLPLLGSLLFLHIQLGFCHSVCACHSCGLASYAPLHSGQFQRTSGCLLPSRTISTSTSPSQGGSAASAGDSAARSAKPNCGMERLLWNKSTRNRPPSSFTSGTLRTSACSSS
jgi:hypothetical protein